MYIDITPYGCFWFCLLLLTVPLKWLFAATLAATLHELCHIVLIRLMGYQIWCVRIGLAGATIETEPLPCWKELLCTLAGPVGSLLLALTFRNMPRVALCAIAQGIYNLLPIHFMDGGRVVHCIAQMFVPQKQADKLCRILEAGAVLALGIILLIFTWRKQLGILPLILIGVLILKTFLRKTPCKQKQLRVQ